MTPYFQSYAHADRREEESFMALLTEHLAASAAFRFLRWNDRDILPGEDWNAEIAMALRECSFGLLLVSPAFLGSRYIGDIELPRLMPTRRVIPVALQRIAFDGSMNLKGLERLQIFHDSHGRAFGECTTRKAKREFTRELFAKIIAVLKKNTVAVS